MIEVWRKTGKKMKFSTRMRPVTIFHLLTTSRNQKVFDDILKLLPAGLSTPLPQLPKFQRNLQSSSCHTRLQKTHMGRGPLLFRKPDQGNKVLQFTLHPAVTGSLSHLFKAKEQFLCSNVWICLFLYWKNERWSFDTMVVPNISSWHYSLYKNSSLESMYCIKNSMPPLVHKEVYAFGSWQALPVPVTKIVSVQEKGGRVQMKFF